MATNQDIQKIIAAAVTNDDFRAQLAEDPRAAVEAAGYDLSDEQVEELANLSTDDIEGLISDVEDRVSKSEYTITASWP